MDVTMPDGTVIQGVPDGVTKAQLSAKYAAHLGGSGAQPTIMQTIAASPVGRFAHDAVLAPISSVASMLAKIDPTGGSVAPMAAKGEQAYTDAVAAQRTRPGYGAARADADAQLAGKGGSGLSDQLIAPVAPALAGTGAAVTGLFGSGRAAPASGPAPSGLDSWLNGMNASADAQADSQAGYAAAHPKASLAANIGGGFLAGPEMAKLPAVAPAVKQVAPSIADLKKGASAAYKAVDRSGLAVNPASYDQMVTDLQAKLDKLGIDPDLHPDATAAFNRVAALKGTNAPLSFQKVMTMRELAGDAEGAIQGRDAMRGGVIKDHIDDFVDNLTPADTVGGADPAQTVATLNDARDLYSRSKQAEVIQDAIDKSGIKAAGYSQSGAENALRSQFRQLALNDRKMARLAPEVQDAVKAVAKGSPVNLALRAVGRFAPHGVVSTALGAGTGFAVGGPAGAVALPIMGEAARFGATALTKAAAQKALETASLGKTRLPQLPVPPLQIPALTSRSAVPYGLFGSSLAQQNSMAGQ